MRNLFNTLRELRWFLIVAFLFLIAASVLVPLIALGMVGSAWGLGVFVLVVSAYIFVQVEALRFR